MKGDYYRYLAEVATGETRNSKFVRFIRSFLHFHFHFFQTFHFRIIIYYLFIHLSFEFTNFIQSVHFNNSYDVYGKLIETQTKQKECEKIKKCVCQQIDELGSVPNRTTELDDVLRIIRI